MKKEGNQLLIAILLSHNVYKIFSTRKKLVSSEIMDTSCFQRIERNFIEEVDNYIFSSNGINIG